MACGGAAPVISTGAPTGETDRSPRFEVGSQEAKVGLFGSLQSLRVTESGKACGGARPPEKSGFGFPEARVQGILEGR